MKKGIDNIRKGSLWVIMAAGMLACSKRTSAPVQEAPAAVTSVSGGFQQVQRSSRTVYCKQLRTMHKHQQSNP